MAASLVPDDFWAAVSPLLPPEPRKHRGGRPRVMPAYASHFADFLIKKLGGHLLLVLGISLTALGLGGGATWLTVLEVLLAAGGAVLLALSVLRPNRSGSP